MDSWTYVVDWKMGVKIAPDFGSGVTAACTSLLHTGPNMRTSARFILNEGLEIEQQHLARQRERAELPGCIYVYIRELHAAMRCEASSVRVIAKLLVDPGPALGH